jgi:hypothetical protein
MKWHIVKSTRPPTHPCEQRRHVRKGHVLSRTWETWPDYVQSPELKHSMALATTRCSCGKRWFR